MRHKVIGKKLGRDIKERKALFKNLIVSLISYGKVETTEAKAKAVRGLVDKLVTKAKQGTLHARRQVLAFLSKAEAVKRLFDEIAPQFKMRRAGFTRLVKIGPRRGDNAPVVVMEWVKEAQSSKLKAQSSRKAGIIKKKHEGNKTDKSKRD